jgi:hypothetical protein
VTTLYREPENDEATFTIVHQGKTYQGKAECLEIIANINPNHDEAFINEFRVIPIPELFEIKMTGISNITVS